MKYSFLFLLALLSCASPKTFERNPASLENAFEQVNKDAIDGTYFKSVETGEPFVISKAKFTSHDQAKSFCKAHKLPMSTMMEIMVFNMATEGKVSYIKIGTTFEFKEGSESGVWLWLPEKKPNADVMMMHDSGETDAQTVSFESLKPKLLQAKIAGLPAVCGKYPEMKMPIPIPHPED